MKKYKLGIIIGRFTIFHYGHKKIIDKALNECEEVLILLGSTNRSFSPKNPFSYEERAAVILGHYAWETKQTLPIIFEPLRDHYYDSDWRNEVFEKVKAYHNNKTVALYGSLKDKPTADYLSDLGFHFQLEHVEPDLLDGRQISATLLRDKIYKTLAIKPEKKKLIDVVNLIEKDPLDSEELDVCRKLTSCLPGKVLDMICVLVDDNLERFYNLYDWYMHDQNYLLAYEKSVKASRNVYYRPNVAADCLVVQSGHVLLIKRKNVRGKNLLALPGGFKTEGENMLECAIRELREETRLKISSERLKKACFKGRFVMDDPNRSEMGEIISFVHIFKLDDSKDLPKVKGSDDAKSAAWYPIDEVITQANLFFEDHALILEAGLQKFSGSIRT